MHKTAITALLVLAALAATRCLGDNLIVAATATTSDAPALLEYTLGGTLMRETLIVPPAGISPFTPRDVGVDRLGRTHVVVRHGVTNDSNLSLCTYDGSGWSHVVVSNWSQSGVTYYGGMGVNDDYLFYPDRTFGGDDTAGILRFPLTDLSAHQHFAVGIWHAVKIGLNGLLYAIDRDGNCSVFHPETMQPLEHIRRKLRRTASVVNVCVGPSGDIYAVDLDNNVNHFDRFGDYLNTATNVGPCGDIEVRVDGTLIVGLADERVLVGNTALAGFSQFALPDVNDPAAWIRNFLCFTPAAGLAPPDPVPARTSGVLLEHGRLRIPFDRYIGQEYALQTSVDLETWSNVSATAAGTGIDGTFEIVPPEGAAHAYYRIRSRFTRAHGSCVG